MSDTWALGSSKLTPKQRHEMANRYAAGESPSALAKIFGVHPNYVGVVARRYGKSRQPRKYGPKTVAPRRKLIPYAGKEHHP